MRDYSDVWVQSTKGDSAIAFAGARSAIAISGKQLTTSEPLTAANGNKSTGVDAVVIG